jgi:hypothetical protein
MKPLEIFRYRGKWHIIDNWQFYPNARNIPTAKCGSCPGEDGYKRSWIRYGNQVPDLDQLCSRCFDFPKIIELTNLKNEPAPKPLYKKVYNFVKEIAPGLIKKKNSVDS